VVHSPTTFRTRYVKVKNGCLPDLSNFMGTVERVSYVWKDFWKRVLIPLVKDACTCCYWKGALLDGGGFKSLAVNIKAGLEVMC
jgi:hypothetical protein